ncbi:hypothetical protein LguiB_005760 [Lonicera macranthoides]
MEKFKNINKLAWATVIYENLMKSIKKHHDDPIRTPGFFHAKTKDGADDGADNKKSKSLDISKEEKERIFNEEIERLNKENNLLRQRIVELETILEVKQSGKLKHLKPRSEELQCETKVVDSSSPLEEKDGLEDYVGFECTTLNDDISFKTPEKHEEENENEEKPKEQFVKSFVLRLKTRKRKQKDDDMFVYYLRDSQRKEENEKNDDTSEHKIVEKHVQEHKCNKKEQKKTKRGKKNSTKENDAPSFKLLVDNTQSTMEAIDADDYEYRTEAPKKSQYRSLKTMREMMQYLEPDQQKVVECFFNNTNRHVDCALYVCDFCEKLICGEPIPKFCNGALMQEKRATITWLILTDEPHSWKPDCSNQEAVDDSKYVASPPNFIASLAAHSLLAVSARDYELKEGRGKKKTSGETQCEQKVSGLSYLVRHKPEFSRGPEFKFHSKYGEFSLTNKEIRPISTFFKRNRRSEEATISE